MGSILSRISDDEDDYKFFCKKFNTEPQELYSIHYNLVNKKRYDETNLSFEEFKKIELEKQKQADIKNIQDEINKLSKKLEMLSK